MINIIDHIKLLFRKDKELYSALFRILGFYPHDISLYKQAMAHSSSAMRSKTGKKINNERLEFLGDAIIEAATSDIVYHHFEQKREGFLTTTRSKLVQRNTLNKLAEDVGLDKLIHSNGHNTGHNNYISGNAFEALVGAIYLDRGYKYCLWFLRSRIISEHLNLDTVASEEVNFKSKLLEWLQKNRLESNFTLDSSEQKKGEPATFHSEIVIEGIVCGKGDGYSKKESQQKASKEALVRLRREKATLNSVLKAKEKRTAIEEQIISLPPLVEPEETTPRYKKPRRRKQAAAREAAAAQGNTPDGKNASVKAANEPAKAQGETPKNRNNGGKAGQPTDKNGAAADKGNATQQQRKNNQPKGRSEAHAQRPQSDSQQSKTDAAPAARGENSAARSEKPVTPQRPAAKKQPTREDTIAQAEQQAFAEREHN